MSLSISSWDNAGLYRLQCNETGFDLFAHAVGLRMPRTATFKSTSSHRHDLNSKMYNWSITSITVQVSGRGCLGETNHDE